MLAVLGAIPDCKISFILPATYLHIMIVSLQHVVCSVLDVDQSGRKQSELMDIFSLTQKRS